MELKQKVQQQIIDVVQKQSDDPLIRECVVFHIFLDTLKQLKLLSTQGVYIEAKKVVGSLELDHNLRTKIKGDLNEAIVYDSTYCIAVLNAIKEMLNFHTKIIDKPILSIKGSINDFIQELQLESGDNLDIKDRFRGALYGKFLGDKLGSKYEFVSKGYNREHVINSLKSNQGFITDDSEMSIMLAFALIDSRPNQLLPAKVAKWYRQWIMTYPPDIGLTTRCALLCNFHEILDESDLYKQMTINTNTKNTGSESNGALMRISPIGMWAIHQSDTAFGEAVVTDVSATHCRKVVAEACGSYCLAMKQLILTGSAEKALLEVSKLNMQWYNEYIQPNPIKTLNKDETKRVGWIKCAWFYSFSYLKQDKCLQEAVVDGVLEKGDTDTDACIAGALIGAKEGYSKRGKDCVAIEEMSLDIGKRPLFLSASVVFDFLNYMLYNGICAEQA